MTSPTILAFPVFDYIFPIVVVDESGTAKSFQGTGFCIAPDLLITCWHCVYAPLASGLSYAAAHAPNVEMGPFRCLRLSDISQEENGSDLALARINYRPNRPLEFEDGPTPFGADVWAFGYPASQPFEGRISITPRVLKGYVTRPLKHRSQFALERAFELDMPAPGGLSGAPVFRANTPRLIGVVYGETESRSITDFERIDQSTGKREPEINKVVTFAVAHRKETLMNARGRSTGGLTVAECVSGFVRPVK